MSKQLAIDFDRPTRSVRVVARTTDPETSHLAAAAFEKSDGKTQRSVLVVVEILAEHGPLTDFQIAEKWAAYWRAPFSESLPRKARLWAGERGKVVHRGFGKHQNRIVRLWAIA